MAQQSSKASAPDLDDLAAQIDQLRRDVSGLTETLGTLAQARAGSAMDGARDTAGDVAAEIDAAVRAQPALSLAMATGLGFVVGLLLGRR